MTDRIGIVYEISCDRDDDIERIARDIALEQTVELPEGYFSSKEINEEIVGKILEINPIEDSPKRYRAIIGFKSEITGYQIPQFLNLLYGNISFKNYIKIVDLKLPETFLDKIGGPVFGTDGIRRMVGVYGRPLFSTALKPMGASPEELANMAEAFALGEGDIVKDDHGLIDHSFCPFEERVKRCQEAIERSNAMTGRNTLYFPNILAGNDEIEKQAQFAVRHGVRGVLLSPFLVGPDMIRYLARQYNLIIMAHPAMTGTYFNEFRHGITPAILLGTVFRLFGADISVYPNVGGRFSFTHEECKDISKALKSPLGNIKPSFPAPAGGMSLENAGDMAKLYGEDAVFLIGGALHTYSDNLTKSTRVFMDEISKYFSERITPPQEKSISSCELSTIKNLQSIKEHLKFEEGFKWSGRDASAYNISGDVNFKDISRQELIGRFGEKTQFDLRYFEIEPGGFSSLERHVHEHVIICLRGEGVLISGDSETELKLNDIAYVSPMRPHRLVNRGDEPFGFFCIVDHMRDRPITG